MRVRNGFSLLELLFVVSLIALCTAWGMPYYSNVGQRNEVDTAMDAVYAALQMARSSALSEGMYVLVCGSRADACVDDFGHALIIFTDRNRNNQRDDDEELKAVVEIPSAVELRLTTFSGRAHVYFQPTGTTEGGNGSILFCHRKADQRLARKIAWTRAGRIRRSQAGSDGYHYYAGERLSCARD